MKRARLFWGIDFGVFSVGQRKVQATLSSHFAGPVKSLGQGNGPVLGNISWRESFMLNQNTNLGEEKAFPILFLLPGTQISGLKV